MVTDHVHATTAAATLETRSTRPAADAELLGRIAAGDKLAMHAFYARHSLRVHRFVLRIVGEQTLAEDITSDVFLVAWRQAGRFEGRSAATTWLLAIARFKAYAALRRRPEQELDESMANAIEDGADDPEQALHKRSRGEILRRCLGALSAENREIIDLVYYHELPLAEIAKLYDIPENTVKTRMFYARKKLAQLARAAGLDREWL